ncbi:hypothetical protein UMZ34_02530 [Halopseudomonas pachastrellae]|nr:hypothetical protein UMZ34_02530 [Halopseudomonas pachastrellae]
MRLNPATGQPARTFCIERLLEPYQSLLERQLSSLYNQRQA